MVSILPRERMVASRVGVEADIRLAAQSVDDLCARLGRTKFIQLGKMQHERSAEVLSFVELLLDPHSVIRSEEHTSELQSLMRISYAVFCLKKQTTQKNTKVRHY